MSDFDIFFWKYHKFPEGISNFVPVNRIHSHRAETMVDGVPRAFRSGHHADHTCREMPPRIGPRFATRTFKSIAWVSLMIPLVGGAKYIAKPGNSENPKIHQNPDHHADQKCLEIWPRLGSRTATRAFKSTTWVL